MATITAGTFFLNALALEYPIIEWTSTVLSFCDEVILIDMGSKDGTRRALRKKFGKRIRVISEPWRFEKDYHEGIPRNVILKNASCDWVFLTDCDEIVHEDDYNRVRSLSLQKETKIFRFPILTFYGSCYLTYHAEKRERFALIQRDPNFNFGPLHNKGSNAADVLKYGDVAARKVIKYKEVNINLYDYGRCRSPKARMRSVDFFVKQHQARSGQAPIGTPTSIKDYILPYPDFESSIFIKWDKGHPKIVQDWVQRHWKSHGWEA